LLLSGCLKSRFKGSLKTLRPPAAPVPPCRQICENGASALPDFKEPAMSGTVFRLLRLSAALLLCSCSLVSYQPLETIDKIDPDSGYRLGSRFGQSEDDTLLVLAFSGGGSRAAAFGYGVLEQLNRQQVEIGGKRQSLLESTDLVYGVSGGSVLAAYYSLHGKDSIPAFEKRFLKQNFQRQVAGQVFSLANMPRLTSPQFGRSDLVQEQFEAALFGQTTFGDLEKRRKGPFAVISATDMSLGSRFDFVQEYFDPMCLNLAKLPIARAVAASSAVPLVFSPITLNNNGGRCGYRRICRRHQSPKTAKAGCRTKHAKNTCARSKPIPTAANAPLSTCSTAA